jgi:hypothetical protein
MGKKEEQLPRGEIMMAASIRVAVEENAAGTMVHLLDMPGAFTRGPILDDALVKVAGEARLYARWAGMYGEVGDEIVIAQRETTNAQLADGDTEILIVKDKELDLGYFQQLMALALKSAEDMQRLYDSIPDKERIDQAKARTTFYGRVPCTAQEMLLHVDRVAGYYLSRIGIVFSFTSPGLVSNRRQSLKLIAEHKQALSNPLTFIDNEYWTTAKVLRRFIWHDRIHARALYRFAVREWGADQTCDPFCFG